MSSPSDDSEIMGRCGNLGSDGSGLAVWERPLLTAQEAGNLLNVPHTWLLQEVRAARVPHVRLGRYVRFPREALLTWVAERERGPRA